MADDTAPSGATPPLRTDDGLLLECEVAVAAEATAGVVLAHPHPLHGGSMRSLVTSELFRALPGHGITAVRFNFRGVGGSEGSHGGGVAERADVVAAIGLAGRVAPELPLVVAGWSFGGDVALTVDDPRLAAWFLIAPPLRSVHLDDMAAAHDPRPKLLVVPEHDAFRPPDDARRVTAGWTATRVVEVAGADHYFAGRTDRVVELLVAFLAEL